MTAESCAAHGIIHWVVQWSALSVTLLDAIHEVFKNQAANFADKTPLQRPTHSRTAGSV